MYFQLKQNQTFGHNYSQQSTDFIQTMRKTTNTTPTSGGYYFFTLFHFVIFSVIYLPLIVVLPAKLS